MSDILLLKNVTAICEDDVTREACSVVIRNNQYVQLSAEGDVLENGCRILEICSCVAPMSPTAFNMLIARHGAILS